MTRHTLHVPAQLNDGQPVGAGILDYVEQRLIAYGGGFTLTEGIGAWRGDDGNVYREPVKLYAVDSASPDTADEILLLARRICDLLDQEAVYVTAIDLTTSLVTVEV